MASSAGAGHAAYRVVCLKDLDSSGDTDAHSREWEVVYPVDNRIIRLFDDLELHQISLPRNFFWDEENADGDQHLRNVRKDWSDLQHQAYQGLVSLAERLLQGGETLSQRAGRGFFEVLPEILTVRSSFTLSFCQHAARSCRVQSWNPERATCQCDIFCLVAKSSAEELMVINQKLRAAK